MSEKFKILSGYIKDLSSETPNVESYLYTKDNISKYELDIDINSKPLKNKLIEVNTTLKFQDKKQIEKKSYFELVYSSIVKIEDEIKKPVISSNQAMMWSCLRRINVSTNVKGFGRLFEIPEIVNPSLI